MCVFVCVCDTFEVLQYCPQDVWCKETHKHTDTSQAKTSWSFGLMPSGEAVDVLCMLTGGGGSGWRVKQSGEPSICATCITL